VHGLDTNIALDVALCYSSSGRNKGQILVGTFCRLLIAIPLKMYSKIGQPEWILVSQMLKLVDRLQWLLCNGF